MIYNLVPMLPPTYKTSRWLLKAYDKASEDRFVEMALDVESVKFMGGANNNKEEERALFKKILALYEKKEGKWFWVWGIYEADRLCAHLEMKETEHTNKNELEIVYMVHPTERRKGLMTEVLAFLKKNQVTWRRKIIATTSPENKNSLALLQKWGITKKENWLNKETGKTYYKLTLDD